MPHIWSHILAGSSSKKKVLIAGLVGGIGLLLLATAILFLWFKLYGQPKAVPRGKALWKTMLNNFSLTSYLLYVEMIPLFNHVREFHIFGSLMLTHYKEILLDFFCRRWHFRGDWIARSSELQLQGFEIGNKKFQWGIQTWRRRFWWSVQGGVERNYRFQEIIIIIIKQLA